MIPSEYGSTAPTSRKSSRSRSRRQPPALVDLGPLERARQELQLRELDALVDPLEDALEVPPASTSSAASRNAFGVVFVYWKRPVSVTSAM